MAYLVGWADRQKGTISAVKWMKKKGIIFFWVKRAGRHFSFLKRAGRHQKGAGRRALQTRPRQNTGHQSYIHD